MNIKKNHYTVYFITFLVIATALLLLSHPHYFVTQMDLTEDQEFYASINGDDTSGGHSSATWIDEASRRWQCKFAYDIEYPFCLYQVYLGNGKDEGVDLSVYDSIELDIQYEGNAKSIIVYMRHFNSIFSKGRKDFDSSKYMRVTIDSIDLKNKTTISLNEFRVADWWLDRYQIPRELRLESFSNVVMFGIQIQPTNKTDSTHEVSINGLTLKGVSVSAEKLYFYTILSWGAIIILIIIFQFTLMFGSIKSREKALKKLKKNNKHLSKENKIFEKLAKVDALTQLFNRTGIEEFINQQRDSLINYAVGVIDVDHFKKLNDTYGHDAGDMVLKEMGVLLKKSIRSEDCVCRWGGEEFVIIWKGIAAEDLLLRANSLCQLIREHIFIIDPKNNIQLNLTVSIGLSSMVKSSNITSAISVADQSLYRAKANGRDRVFLVSDII